MENASNSKKIPFNVDAKDGWELAKERNERFAKRWNEGTIKGKVQVDKPTRYLIEAGQVVLLYRWAFWDKKDFKVISIYTQKVTRTCLTHLEIFFGTMEEVQAKCLELGIILERYMEFNTSEAPPFEKPEEEGK